MRLSSKLTWISQSRFLTIPVQNIDDQDRVEAIASASSLDVDLKHLRKSIRKLQSTSVALDKEKASAERHLKRIVRRIVRRKVIRRKLRKAWCRLRKVFGKECGRKDEAHGWHHPTFTTETGQVVELRGSHTPVWLKEHRGRNASCNTKARPWKKLHKAVKRVQAANSKLVAFERGLISKEGIKDREWFKHLGVAPGKWLGKFYLFIELL